MVQGGEHPAVYLDMLEGALSVIVKVTVVDRLLVADELIEMPPLYVEHEEAHAPTAIP